MRAWRKSREFTVDLRYGFNAANYRFLTEVKKSTIKGLVTIKIKPIFSIAIARVFQLKYNGVGIFLKFAPRDELEP